MEKKRRRRRKSPVHPEREPFAVIIRQERRANAVEVFNKISAAWKRTFEESERMADMPGCSNLDMAIHGIIKRIIETGDVKSFVEFNMYYCSPMALMDDNVSPEDILLLARVKQIIAMPAAEKAEAILSLMDPLKTIQGVPKPPEEVVCTIPAEPSKT